ncbi:MAG: hypothetical protein EGQ91_01825 [Clostridiales bacterium]|nr:hypothetical protein [Clostridiales bacterium]
MNDEKIVKSNSDSDAVSTEIEEKSGQVKTEPALAEAFSNGEEDIAEKPESEKNDDVKSETDGLKTDETESKEPASDEIGADITDSVKSNESEVEYVESPYVKEQFLHYGFDNDLDFIAVDETFDYLKKSGFSDNSLTQARERAMESSVFELAYDPHNENCRYCDFCGAELTGVEYEIIADGRERCNECSNTVLKTVDEFKEAFLEVRKNMEAMFGIKILASVDVKTMDARKLARKLRIKFTPTPGFDGRVLGVAINEKGVYRLYVENQSPYLNAVATIAHELTHIWQYVNWNRKNIIKKYGAKLEKCIYEGMAKWVEIQYLYFINEPERAYRELCATLQREDEYGFGLKLYLAEYDLSRGVNVDIVTPFYDADTPLHDI